MELSAYLREQDVTFAEFARQIKVRSRMTVVRYCRGERMPTRDIMERITAATGGRVTANDFYGGAAAPEPIDGAAAATGERSA